MNTRFHMSWLLFFSFAITLVILFLIITGGWMLIRNEADAANTEMINNALTDVSGAINDRILSLKSGCDIAASFADVRAFLAGDEKERIEDKKNVRTELTGLVYYEQGAVGAYLITHDGAHLSAFPGSNRYDSIVPHLVCQSVLSDYDLLSPYRQQIITECYRVSDHAFFAVLTPVYPDQAIQTDENYLGTVILVVDIASLTDLVPYSVSDKYILSDHNGILVSSSEQYTQKWENDPDEGFISSLINGTTWSFSIGSMTVFENSTVDHVGKLCIVFGISLAVFLIILLLVQYNHIVVPVQKLTKQTQSITPDNGNIVTPVGSCDELHVLSTSMNSMLLRLHQMNEQMVQDKLMYYEDRITFLQAQINPHSLYNSFECIRGMAATGENEKIREMTTCLARIYRYCCKGETFVSLKEEIECLKYYSRVLDLRYSGRYQIHADSDEQSDMIRVPRMILQPLAENAVQHGMVTPGRTTGNVWFSSCIEDEHLIIRIRDDGIGMSEEMLRRYNGKIAMHDDGTHSHIGITNVLRRLNMIYRSVSLLENEAEEDVNPANFENDPAGGLIITLRIPVISEKTASKN